jgi:tyrosyl-tRNA synthetase
MKNDLPSILTRGVSEVLPSAGSLAKLMSEKKIRVYLGIDPTASFLTFGHTVVLRKLQQFADEGHHAILLIGSGTVRIGDPTGRDTARPVLTDEQIHDNFKSWKKQVGKVLDFDKIEVRYNGDWLDKLTFADIVKLAAKATVSQLIERDMFQTRIKNGLPVYAHEILYPLIQGYDSVAMDVDLEIGGTDQTFNMLMGRELQKVYNGRDKWTLSTPILSGTDGRKMSKSFGNYIALTDQPNDMYGKVMSINDELIVDYFNLLTDVPTTEIEEIHKSLVVGDNPMKLKKLLAYTITKTYHSNNDAILAEKYFENTFQKKEVPSDIPVIKVQNLNIKIIDLLKLCLPEQSNSYLKRLIEQGGVELLPDKLKVKNKDQEIKINSGLTLRIGKLRYFKIN